MTATAVPTSTEATTARPARNTRRTRRLVTRLGLVLVAGAVLLGSTACSSKEAEFIDMTNNTRAQVGAPGLESNFSLWLKAGAWSIKMAGEGRLSHSNLSDGNTYNWKALGENVGTGGDLASIYSALTRSPGHYANIVDTRFQYLGVGVYYDGSRYWVTQEFMQL